MFPFCKSTLSFLSFTLFFILGLGFGSILGPALFLNFEIRLMKPRDFLNLSDVKYTDNSTIVMNNSEQWGNKPH